MFILIQYLETNNKAGLTTPYEPFDIGIIGAPFDTAVSYRPGRLLPSQLHLNVTNSVDCPLPNPIEDLADISKELASALAPSAPPAPAKPPFEASTTAPI